MLALTGCSRHKKVADPFEKPEFRTNLESIGQAYRKASTQLKHPPKNAEELKPFLKEFGDPDSILVSPHDGQPYVILWGRDISNRSLQIIAHERQGVNGTRFVLTAFGAAPMSDEEFQKQDLRQKP
jgi:hypothetical protein